VQGFARQMAPERAGPKPIPLGGDSIPF